MADKSFGVKDINLIGASGTPEIESPNNLNINAVNVAISTDMSIGGALTVAGDLTVNGTTTTIDTAVTSVDSLSVDGNVGIGTTNATSILDVRNGTIVKDQDATQNSANPGLQLKHNGTINGSWRHDGRLEIGGQDADAEITLSPNGSASFDGDVYVNANLLVKGGNGSGVFIRNQGDTAYTIDLNENGSAALVGPINLGAWANNANAAIYMVNQSNTGSIILKGNGSSDIAFGVYKNGWSGSNAVARINANGGATFGAGGFVIESDGEISTNIKTAGIMQFDSTGSYASPKITLHSVTGDITCSGQVTAAGGFSDIRFKENITDANPQLADAVALGSQLKNWDWKDDAPLNDELRAKRFLGLVAQEAEKVCPGLTYTIPRTKQGAEITPETTDAEGNVIPATYEEIDDSFKAINHDILVMKLLGAVAEQNTRIETLEAKVAALEG